MTDTAEHAPITRDDFDEIDRAALDKCLALTLADDDLDRAAQVRGMQIERGWWEAASFCAYHRQFEHLSLDPWESTPCWIDPDEIDAIIAKGPLNNHEFGAAKLLKKMLAHNVSRFDPSAIDAIAAASQGRAGVSQGRTGARR